MAFLFKSPAPIGKKKRRSPGNLRLLNMLERYITDTEAVPISILTKFWADQAASITYKEIRKMIEDGDVSKEDLENWSKDYSILVEGKLAPLWEEAIIVGQIGNMILDSLKNSDFEFDPSDEGIRKWIEQRGADFVTNSVQEQKKAIRRLTAKAVREELSPDELSRVIRPCIGLNSRQAEANLRYYNNIKAQLRKEHPKMKQETIVRRARDKALKYAEKQHRYRAKTIALDELAEVYNQGAHFGIKQAQKKGYIGHVRKVWVTARQESVCKYCEAVEGVSKELDEPFDVGKCGMVQVPPAHPRCRCVLKYVEVREDKQ